MCERAITEKWKKGMEVEGGNNRVKELNECVCVTLCMTQASPLTFYDCFLLFLITITILLCPMFCHRYFYFVQ